MGALADTYRLIAGILIFILFISLGLGMASTTFSDLAPGGQSPLNSVPGEQKPFLPVPPPSASCDFWCATGLFFINVVNGAVAAGSTLGGLIGLFFALLTFQIPALQANLFTRMINFMVIVPIVVVIVLFSFRLIKGVIPTIGGDAD